MRAGGLGAVEISSSCSNAVNYCFLTTQEDLVHKVAIALAIALGACHFKPDPPPPTEILFSMVQPVAYDAMGQCVGSRAKNSWDATVEVYPRTRLVRVVVPPGAEFLVRPEGPGSSVDLLYFPTSAAGSQYELEREGRQIVRSCRALPPPPPSPYREL